MVQLRTRGRPILFAALLALAFSSGCFEQARADLPNVMLVTIDTLRADHLDLYGYDKETAPFIRSLGERGAVFTNAFSTSSWTAPSTASIFTGRHPANHGVTMGIRAHRRIAERIEDEGRATVELNRIPDRLAVLPEVLGDAGYTAFGVSTNLNVGHHMGFDRGFERMKLKNMASVVEVRERLERWRDEIDASQPWLLYLHLNDVHAPYQAQAPWFEPTGDQRGDLVASYDSEIRQVDGVLQELVASWQSQRPMLIVLLSDHGEEFWERGELGHRLSLHGEVNRVAFIVHGPEIGVKPGRYDDNVSLVDLLPTLADLLGIAGPGESDGVSLAPLLRFDEGSGDLQSRLAERVLVGHRADEKDTGRELWSAIRGPWKLIEEAQEQGAVRSLYDLSADPEEVNDLIDEESARALALSQEIDAFRRGASASEPPIEVSIDRERLEALRELGYVEE